MGQTTKFRAVLGILLLAVIFNTPCNAAEQSRAYQSGFSIVLKLGGELSEALPDKFGKQIDAPAIALQPQDSPVVSPIATTETKLTRQVVMSAGFIDLINHLCHAKAIDHIQPGYFDQYVKNLAAGTGGGVTQAPNIVEARFWTDNVINDQMSYFNQMIGFMMALNFSHHYLGHYTKYSPRMIGAGNKIGAINELLTPAEWEVSVRAAAVNSLDCALATDGCRALFQAIDKMPTRPAWASYVIPAHVDIKKLDKQLAHYEELFFRGQLK
ncbi:MAG TPA: hypothetical protein VGO67_08555 [Verrucomicrobiae bacterium]|jgi:hypothetical protein